ncbi:MAG TPA: tripartite tricarboxylate transporter substrate binding protein [Burkholderiales bacterium]|nr:tripartite tricarboxylate transporter substrate binding protein [Burkholderiales bacterium]
MKATRRSVALGFALALHVAAADAQTAQKPEVYPVRPIRIVVGGGPETLARLVGQKLTEAWGQQVIVDQRGGGAAAVSAEVVAASKPDGYTLLLATSTHATHMVIPGQAGQSYDLIRDFAPITLAASTAFILCVHPSLPVRSVGELVRFARSKPDSLNYASGGSGSPPHLTMELFKSMTGTRIVHVPYKTIAAGVTDLIAGQVQVMFTVAPSGLPHIATGRLRALAVSSGKRSPFIAELPTVAESGVRGFDIFTWNGVLAPAATPPAILAKLHGGIVAALDMPEVRERIASSGFERLGTTSEEFGRFLRAEVDRWAKVVEVSGARAE